MANREALPQPPDVPERQRIATELDRTLLVEAAAGTGKTTSMLDRMVALVGTGRARIEQMAAVTFTRKAAAELRSRFGVELERAARDATGREGERLAAAVGRVERCFVGTIHSFCARLLRERPIEAGVDLAFTEMDDQQDAQLRREVWAEYVAGLYADGAGVIDELRELGIEIGQLRASFVRFAEYPDVDEWPAPDVELEGIEGAVAALEQYLEHIQALIPTFPNDRGTDKLMDSYEQVARLARNRDLRRPNELMEVLEIIKPSPKVTQKCWPEGKEQAKAERDRWIAFAEQTAQPLVARWREKRYAAVIGVLTLAAELYHRRRQAAGRLNYQDLLMRASDLLADKPSIRRYFRRRFTHILVDEFQDTDPVQAEVMMYLTADDPEERDWRKCRPVPGSLFVVGDPKQSIYRFRRADIATYKEVKRLITDSGGAVVPLTANFRTREDLVNWGNGIFDETFPSTEDEFSPASSAMQVGRDEASGGELAGIRVLEIPAECSNKEDSIAYDAGLIARTIRHALDAKLTVPRSRKEVERGAKPQVTPGDFLIVTWGKKQLADYARPLERLGIPHQVTGGSALGRIEELRLLADCLRAVSEPENPVALVAVLRGALFGISDAELYAFRRAGGRIHYRREIPGEMEEPISAKFAAAFARLQRYAAWLRRLPPVAAIERIAADLGLPARALAEPGGDVRAGSMAKALEMLRRTNTGLKLVSDMASQLAELIEADAEFDGLPARPHDAAVVRVMNLHKAKGLEAPIVFLANPTGKWSPTDDLHIDRAGDLTRGYLAVYGETTGWQKPLLACPAGWEEHVARENLFRDAELNRLRYVAATRTAALLVVTRKAKNNRTNHWSFFDPYLEQCELLGDPGAVAAPVNQQVEVTAADVVQAAADAAGRWDASGRPSYATAAAKEISLTPSGLHRGPTSGEHGTEWGTVIHLLLETAMREPAADLEPLALAALAEQGLEPSRAGEAVETVRSVMAADVWQRAMASGERHVEIPFQRCLPACEGKEGLPTVLRGVIDLAFREATGWVIVDYKTDAAADGNFDALVDHYRPQLQTYAESWNAIVGEPVVEQGLYFTRGQRYVTV